MGSHLSLLVVATFSLLVVACDGSSIGIAGDAALDTASAPADGAVEAPAATADAGVDAPAPPTDSAPDTQVPLICRVDASLPVLELPDAGPAGDGGAGDGGAGDGGLGLAACLPCVA